MRIGYVGVRPVDPFHLQSQLPALESANCAQTYIEMCASTTGLSSELANALTAAGPGDQLVITKLDQLGPVLADIVDLVEDLRSKEIDLVVLDQGIDTSGPDQRIFLEILQSIAEIGRPQAAELEPEPRKIGNAPRNGDRRRKLNAAQANSARAMHRETDEDGRTRYTVTCIAATFGVSRPTIYRYLKPAPGDKANKTHGLYPPSS